MTYYMYEYGTETHSMEEKENIWQSNPRGCLLFFSLQSIDDMTVWLLSFSLLFNPRGDTA
jgi:hypothetical protein